MLRKGLLLAALSLAPHLGLHAQHPEQKQRILIDTDAGDDIDDAFALAYALRTPSFDILGITTTFGDTRLRAHLVAHLLSDAGRPNIPLAAGVPSTTTNGFTQSAYAHADHHALSTRSAADLILATAHAHPGQVTLVAIGPLNNIGDAITQDPAGFRLLKRVVIMGGSIHRGYGPPGTPPAPEWNILNNVEGARKLLTVGVPVYMMPLDATQIPLRSPLKDSILTQPTGLSHALAELVHEFNRPITLFDALTMAYVSDPTLCPTQPMHIAVDDKGNTLATPGPPNANVCLQSNEPAFFNALNQHLVH
jgi:inosine-uridine nucleoside N-ribohydrolase